MAFLSSGGALSSAACSLLALCGSPLGGAHDLGVSGEGPVGTWGGPRTGQPEMVIEVDGSVHGHDGCNRFSGAWRPDGAGDGGAEGTGTAIIFRDFIVTQAHCPGADTWLSGAWTAVAGERSMSHFDAGGHEIGALPRR